MKGLDNMLDKIRKMKIGNKEYGFKMTNKTVLKIDEKYENYALVINGIMEGKQFYNNAIKLLTCCCVDQEIKEVDGEKIKTTKEFTIDELIEKLTPEQINTELIDFVLNLYWDYMGVNKTEETQVKEENEDKEKN
ncbi:RNA polymerase subunit sigma [Clostridium botulinum]|nr:RNA polymerase subunit sigma [Clostridium botulinum]